MSDLGPRARRRVRIAGLAAGLAAAVLVAIAGSGLRQSLFDLFQTLGPASPVSGRVHVVAIDADSLREVGGWPWSRFYLARLVEQIAGRGASVIGLDMLLPEPDRLEPAQFARLYTELPPSLAADIVKLPSMDAVFARVIGRGPVVLARAGVTRGSFDSLDASTAVLPPEAKFDGATPRKILEFPTVVANLPILDGAALGHGLVNGDRDTDGVVRRVPLVARAGGQLTPGFALELVRVAEGAPGIGLEGENGRLDAVLVKGLRVSATRDGQLLMRFGDWRGIRTTSAVNLLRQGMPSDLFKGQIVLIGLTSAGAAELINTPRARALYSVYVQAEAVDEILRGVGLRRPGWAAPAEWGMGLLLALVAWFGVPRLHMAAVAGAAAAGVAAAFGASWFAFQQGLLIDPFPMLAPAAAASAALVVMLFVEGRRLQARLRSALERQRHRTQEHQRLLLNELNHRVKNSLATIQSIAVQTLRSDRSTADVREAFIARLMALSTAHNLLTAEGWESADLKDVVRMGVAAFDEPPGARFTIFGESRRLNAPHALAMAMALHELGSNAAKYGALSVEGGRVWISWKDGPDGEVRFVWEEAGGPTVEPPVRRGFGTRLIQVGLARELGGQVHIEHRPAGLRCEIAFRCD